jgi:hypothetical protein
MSYQTGFFRFLTTRARRGGRRLAFTSFLVARRLGAGSSTEIVPELTFVTN